MNTIAQDLHLLNEQFAAMIQAVEAVIYKKEKYQWGSINVSLHSVWEGNFCFAYTAYDGGGTFKSDYFNITVNKLNKLLNG